MYTVLLTSGRVAFTLALARRFHAAGFRVLVADSWPRALCKYSNAVERYFHVPPPALQTSQWVGALSRIVDEQQVDLIVPIFEEALHLMRALPDMPNPPKVFAADFSTLHTVHNKWLFNQKARELGLPAPETTLLSSREDLLSDYARGDGQNKVYKRVYSRFATHKVAQPKSLEALAKVEPTPAEPWVAQAFLPGRPVATFGLAHQGYLTAHACYAGDFSLGFGPTAAYRPLEQPKAFAWVRSFVESLQYTGQIGIDFIEDGDGNVSAIECNPRMTGGMFLLKDDPEFAAAYIDPDTRTIFPKPDRAYAFRMALLFAPLLRKDYFPGMKEWARVFFRARSVNPLSGSDPLPRIVERPLRHAMLIRCLRERKNFRTFATEDFDWSRDLPPVPVPADESSRAGQVVDSGG